MSRISLGALLNRIGYPFPMSFKNGEAEKIAKGYSGNTGSLIVDQSDTFGFPVVRVTDASLGRYDFMPVFINDGLKEYELPNAVIMISGEKGVIETDVVDRGTVFEKVYERPYDISIVTTIIGDNYKWPANQYREMSELYRGKRYEDQGKEIAGRDLVTLKCALTNPFLQEKNNFLITKISVLDNEYSENMEVIQIEGRSNIDFELVYV